MTNNTIFFRRAGKVVVPAGTGVPVAMVASLDANLRRLGYALSGDLAADLVLRGDSETMKSLHDTLVHEAKEIKGVRRYRPMYPNFPRQVMEASEAELYVNAIMHYFGDVVGLRILPVYEKQDRPELDFSEDKFKFIGAGTQNEWLAFLVNLFSSKSAFSDTDKADVRSLNDAEFDHAYVNATLDNRENKAFIGAEAVRRGVGLIHKMDTATDVLRLAVAMSDGDVSLSDKTRFRSYRRIERSMLLNMLDNIESPQEDMARHLSAWKRLGERLHPGEYASRFPNAAKAFESVRSNDSVETFNAKVERLLADKDALGAARLLRTRPGDFARRLDHVLRLAPHGGVRSEIIHIFGGVAKEVSPTVLLQTRNAFINRDKAQRVFFPKGSVAKMQVVDDKRDGLGAVWTSSVVNIIDGALGTIFGERESLGGSFVDPVLKGIAVPFGLRNASKAVKTLGRGSRLPLDTETGIIRFFIWWKNATADTWGGRTDIDLSAICLDENFANVFDITYYNLREQGAVHSGDIISAPNGASEFIDIDVNRLREQGVRYVAMTLYSYSGQNFAELPECFAGFMERADLDSGEVYDPRTVTNKVDLTAASRSATPFIFDLETGEAIWVDLTMRVQAAYANAYNSRQVTKTVVQAMVELTPPNLYDLFVAHATARGGLTTREKATTVFSMDGDVTPFDTEEILANYL